MAMSFHFLTLDVCVGVRERAREQYQVVKYLSMFNLIRWKFHFCIVAFVCVCGTRFMNIIARDYLFSMTLTLHPCSKANKHQFYWVWPVTWPEYQTIVLRSWCMWMVFLFECNIFPNRLPLAAFQILFSLSSILFVKRRRYYFETATIWIIKKEGKIKCVLHVKI